MINNTVSKDIFFHGSGREKKFGNYSKKVEDIYRRSYLVKKNEINSKYTSRKIFALEDLIFLDSLERKKFNEKYFLIKENPYELFIAGIISFHKSQFRSAISLLLRSSFLLNKESEVTSDINLCFNLIQISQCLDALGKKSLALKVLISIVSIAKRNPLFMIYADILIASVFMRLAVYGERIYRNYRLVHTLMFLSIKNRLIHKAKYPGNMCELYLSTSYRLYAKTWVNSIDQYFWFKKALSLKFQIIHNNDSDEFSKIELVYLLFDMCRFLIVENFKLDLNIKYSRLLNKSIISLDKKNRDNLAESILKYALMLSKYFLSIGMQKSIYWFYVCKYFESLVKDQSLKSDFQLYKERINEYLT